MNKADLCKQGISLTLEQYNALMSAVPLIESVLTKKGDRVVRPEFDEDISVVEQNSDEEEEDVKRADADQEEDE